MILSIVITSYKRPALLPRAVRSALAFCNQIQDGEIILIDDSSRDESLEIIMKEFCNDIEQGRLRLAEHLENHTLEV